MSIHTSKAPSLDNFGGHEKKACGKNLLGAQLYSKLLKPQRECSVREIRFGALFISVLFLLLPSLYT